MPPRAGQRSTRPSDTATSVNRSHSVSCCKELALVRELNWRAWPPRLPEQPIFYPVLNEDYAIKIARDWNVKHDGAGFVTRFEVESDFLSRYPVQQAGGQTILELWVPAEELDEFNAHIVGEIEVVHEFH
ncbi:hypothetical protein [Streptomyces abikoensis]|uniref:Crystallin n=1 Tax=Streptomyces abikoensis TaxID=97398 RepID=A0ABW7TH42_9ACTN